MRGAVGIRPGADVFRRGRIMKAPSQRPGDAMNLEALAEQLASKWFFLAKPSSAEVLAALIKVRDAEKERCAVVAQDRHKQWHADMDTCEVCDDESACADIAAAIRKGE